MNMKLKELKYFAIAALAGSTIMVSCVEDPNSPGLEYMPDMYRSPAAEAYVDYAEVEGVFDEEAKKLVEERFSFVPPAGTIPYYGTGEGADVMMPYKHGAPVGADKTHGLYGVKQDPDGRIKADADVNPIPFSDEVLKEGKKLYESFCIHCHGESGDGQGTVITNSLGKFPTPGPYKDTLTAGGIFWTITYGKGAMGSHAAQLNKEERWKIVHYVEKLQGKEQGVAADTSAVVMPMDEAAEGEGEMIEEGAEGHEDGHAEGGNHEAEEH
ncbi:MAG: cytochrome c [Flavobacteriales bacterium]|nr:cytochrome c [Flavobacteriales bacterium]